jgi:hypothetical protein
MSARSLFHLDAFIDDGGLSGMLCIDILACLVAGSEAAEGGDTLHGCGVDDCTLRWVRSE